MEQINLKLLLKYFFSKSIILVLIVFLFGILGFCYTKFNKGVTTYQSCVTMIIEKDSSEIILNNNKIELSQKNLNEIYVEIIKSDDVIKKMIENLDLSYSPDFLIRNITIKMLDDNEAIRVYYTSSTKGEPETIISEITSLFQKEVKKAFDVKEIKTFFRTDITNTANNSNDLSTVIKFIIIGFILAVLILFVVYYFSFSIKSVEDLNDVGLEIVGTVPKMRGIKRE